MLGLVVLMVLVLIAIFGPNLAQWDPYELGTRRLAPPSTDHWMGTDQLGRDVWTRIMYGVRPSITVAPSFTFNAMSATDAGVIEAAVRRTLHDEVQEMFRGVYADAGMRFA